MSSTDINTLDDTKSLKRVIYVTDRVIKALSDEVQNLELLKLRTLERITRKTGAMKTELETAEKKFLITWSAKPAAATTSTKITEIDIGSGLRYGCPIYETRDAIPQMSYGAVMQNSRPLVLFRYSAKDFVSVTACRIIDFNNTADNHHTVCCGNVKHCDFGAQCKYFHDPAIWPDSDHVQKFTRTNLVKKCPYFGDSELIREQSEDLAFENLRTLARYCAIMMLYISRVAQK